MTGTRLHHVQVGCPRGGEGEARRFYGEGLGLREVQTPPGLAARGGAWFRAYDDTGAVTAELHMGVEEPFAPARKAHPALLLPPRKVLEEVVLRVGMLGYAVDRSEWATFPGYRRVHVNDGFGNRVELLARPAATPSGP